MQTHRQGRVVIVPTFPLLGWIRADIRLVTLAASQILKHGTIATFSCWETTSC